MNPYDVTTAPTIIDYHDQCAADEHAQPLPSCLGPGCCPQCGWSRDDCHCAEYAAEDAAIAEKGE